MKSSRIPPFRVLPVLGLCLSFIAGNLLAQQGPRVGPVLTAPAAPAPEASAAPAVTVVDVPPPESVQTDLSEIEFDAIVRVEVDTKQPNYRVPWNVGGMGSGNGTGFLVGPNRFVTNAHVVSDSRLIYIKKVNDPKPYQALVLFVAHDCDLAMLELESDIDF